MHKVTVLPQGRILAANTGDNLHQLLFKAGLSPAAPCGGTGKCGKCLVTVDGIPRKACETLIRSNLVVELPPQDSMRILKSRDTAAKIWNPLGQGYCAAFDLGTTTVCCSLLDKADGREIASRAAVNPQRCAGADVVSRIRSAVQGNMAKLTELLRDAAASLLLECCADAGVSPEEIELISVVGNPAMQQFFLGIPVDNLISIPFASVLTRTELIDSGKILPDFPRGRILVIPDISAYVGADTVGCILSSEMDKQDETVLLVDIGTNGEMVLSHRGRMLSCAAAAGSALEGADISCGMNAMNGAVDRVWVENEALRFHVIGEVAPAGICGSGLIDAAASTLELGLLNSRGKLKEPIELAEGVHLTQEDIRALQLAKGAIRGGIEILCSAMGITPGDIDSVLLAGAFGSYLNPVNACRIGLLPPVKPEKCRAMGNAALRGAKLLCRDRFVLDSLDVLVARVESVELSTHRDFPKAFARGMRFPEKSEEIP